MCVTFVVLLDVLRHQCRYGRLLFEPLRVPVHDRVVLGCRFVKVTVKVHLLSVVLSDGFVVLPVVTSLVLCILSFVLWTRRTVVVP